MQISRRSLNDLGEDILWETFTYCVDERDRFKLARVCRMWMKVLCNWTFNYAPLQLGSGFDMLAPYMLAPLNLDLTGCDPGISISKLLPLYNLTALDIRGHPVPAAALGALSNLKCLTLTDLIKTPDHNLGSLDFLPSTCTDLIIDSGIRHTTKLSGTEVRPEDVAGLCNVKNFSACFMFDRTSPRPVFRAPAGLTYCNVSADYHYTNPPPTIRCDFSRAPNLKTLVLKQRCTADKFHPNICLEKLEWSGGSIASTPENQSVVLSARCIRLWDPEPERFHGSLPDLCDIDLVSQYPGDVAIVSRTRWLSKILDDRAQKNIKLVEYDLHESSNLDVGAVLRDVSRISTNLRHLRILRIKKCSEAILFFADDEILHNARDITFLDGLADILDNCNNLQYLTVPEEATYCLCCKRGPAAFNAKNAGSICDCSCWKLGHLKTLQIVPIYTIIKETSLPPSITPYYTHIDQVLGTTLLDLRDFDRQCNAETCLVSYRQPEEMGQVRDARKVNNETVTYQLVFT